jgi:aromatic ring hydroxylase
MALLPFSLFSEKKEISKMSYTGRREVNYEVTADTKTGFLNEIQTLAAEVKMMQDAIRLVADECQGTQHAAAFEGLATAALPTWDTDLTEFYNKYGQDLQSYADAVQAQDSAAATAASGV